VKPEIHVLGLSIKTFGLFFALNFAAWGLLAARRLKELGRPVDWAYEIVTVALIGGLVGARGYSCCRTTTASASATSSAARG